MRNASGNTPLHEALRASNCNIALTLIDIFLDAASATNNAKRHHFTSLPDMGSTLECYDSTPYSTNELDEIRKVLAYHALRFLQFYFFFKYGFWCICRHWM